MAIRSIGAKALQQNKIDWANGAETNSVATQSLGTASAGSEVIGSGTKVTPATRNLRRWLAAGCLGLIAIGSSGCTMTAGLGRSLSQSECIDDFMIGYRNKAMAEKAWHCRKDRFCNQCYGREFKDGFIKGYAEVAEGGNGCTPAIAPSQYLGWRYQSAGGQGAVNAWFQGFPEGVRAAEEDGVGHWRRTPYSGMAAPASANMAAPGAVHSGPLGPGVTVPGSTTPIPIAPPANPFYSGQEMIPAPMNGLNRSSNTSSPSDVDVEQLFGGSTPVSDGGSGGLPFSFE